jgi:hypothetical protein
VRRRAAQLSALARNREKGVLIAALRGSARGAAPDHRSVRDAAASAEPLAHHREATYRWLCRAQDAGGGVAGFLDLWTGRWSAPYPETTGYIIPTFLAVAEAGLDEEARPRALRMADWSCEVQMEEGAVLSGLLGWDRGPAVFNTGQAIFGWVSAYEASGRERYAESAHAACRWLLDHQDPDGAWKRRLSMTTTGPVHTYNGRCAWALAYAAQALGEPDYLEAARLASDWVLAQQNDRGWFAHNGFAPGEVPLLHTIAYVIEGLIGVYAFTGERRYLDAARRALDPIADLRRARGPVPGRLDASWQGTVPWRCLTGEAQVAVVLLRLEHHCPGHGYADVASLLIDDVARAQHSLIDGARLADSHSPAAGGVSGSFPLWGQYLRFGLPNWAAKFHLDALLLATAGADEYGFPTLAAASR